MIRKGIQIYCDNEHGTGDVTFPDDGIFDPFKNTSAVTIRRAARLAGWRRIMGADYCPGCIESIVEQGQNEQFVKAVGRKKEAKHGR